MNLWKRRRLTPWSPANHKLLPDVYPQKVGAAPEPVAQATRVVPISQAKRVLFVMRITRNTQPVSYARLIVVQVWKEDAA